MKQPAQNADPQLLYQQQQTQQQHLQQQPQPGLPVYVPPKAAPIQHPPEPVNRQQKQATAEHQPQQGFSSSFSLAKKLGGKIVTMGIGYSKVVDQASSMLSRAPRSFSSSMSQEEEIQGGPSIVPDAARLGMASYAPSHQDAFQAPSSQPIQSVTQLMGMVGPGSDSPLLEGARELREPIVVPIDHPPTPPTATGNQTFFLPPQNPYEEYHEVEVASRRGSTDFSRRNSRNDILEVMSRRGSASDGARSRRSSQQSLRRLSSGYEGSAEVANFTSQDEEDHMRECGTVEWRNLGVNDVPPEVQQAGRRSMDYGLGESVSRGSVDFGNGMASANDDAGVQQICPDPTMAPGSLAGLARVAQAVAGSNENLGLVPSSMKADSPLVAGVVGEEAPHDTSMAGSIRLMRRGMRHVMERMASISAQPGSEEAATINAAAAGNATGAVTACSGPGSGGPIDLRKASLSSMAGETQGSGSTPLGTPRSASIKCVSFAEAIAKAKADAEQHATALAAQAQALEAAQQAAQEQDDPQTDEVPEVEFPEESNDVVAVNGTPIEGKATGRSLKHMASQGSQDGKAKWLALVQVS